MALAHFPFKNGTYEDYLGGGNVKKLKNKR
jgi:hypothetical protein